MKLLELDLSASEKMVREEEFFSKRYALSYSGASKLSYCPKLFYNHYILGEKEILLDKTVMIGKLIHCLLLRPEEFDNLFVITPSNLPSDNLVAIFNKLFAQLKLTDGPISEDLRVYDTYILALLVDCNLYQSLKTDESRMAKVLTDKCFFYWKFLIAAETRDVIDDAILAEARTAIQQITSNTPLMQIMGWYGGFEVTQEQFNEIELHGPMEELLFDIKGILDNLVIDHTHKEIRINDLKKTSKDIVTFSTSLDHFRYDLQAAMYYTLVKKSFGDRYPDYKITFRFIVIDNMLQIAPVRISDETMAIYLESFNKMLTELEWHFKERRFDLPYSVAINNEILL